MGASGADDRGAMDVSLDRSGRQRARVQPRVAVTDQQPGTGPGGRPPGTPRDDGLDAPLFTRAALDYAAHRPGQSLTLLQAGAATAESDPDVATLRAAGGHIAVSLIDDDSLAARAAVRAHPELASCALGDLRITPLPPRSFDI